MNMLHILLDALIALAAGLVVSICLSCMCWTLFKVIGHPELGVPVALAVLLGLMGRQVFAGPVLRTAFACSAGLAIPLWLSGMEWRRARTTTRLTKWKDGKHGLELSGDRRLHRRKAPPQ